MKNRSLHIFERAIKSPESKRVYMYSLHEFMRFIKIKEYDDILKISSDKIERHLEDWIMTLSKKGLKATTIKGKLAAVELFLEMNRVVFYKKIIRKLILTPDYIQGGKKPFTTEDIQKMLDATTKLRTKALVHFFASIFFLFF